ncbi:MAG: hypothetical protein ACRDOM_01990 [Nocardioides sp.]
MRTHRGLARAACTGLLLVAVASACGPSLPASAPSPSPSSSISTLTPLPMPDMGPPEGKVVADLRQASRDAALNRFQVWIGNGLARDLDPTRIAYRDPRFPDPISGERLRLNPSGSERGYPLALPPRPVCAAPRQGARGAVTIAFGARSITVTVEDEADVVERYVATRCLEFAVARVARLSFLDAVPPDSPGEGGVGTLTLVVRPSGTPGGRLTIDSVGGTPVLTPSKQSGWRPDVTVRSNGEVQRIELPVIPARCDGHAFLESGSATAFIVSLHLNGRAGEVVVRMSPEGAANAFAFARESCGL